MSSNRFTLLTLLALTACGTEETTGRRVRLETVLAADVQAGVPFTAASGWTISLSRAVIASGPLYYFDGAPAVATRPTWRRWLAALAPVAVAHAHPGHYGAGRAKGQMLEPFSADLLGAPTLLPAGEGLTGPVRSGSFSFAAPVAGPAVPALGGHVAVVAGSASKGDRTVHFQIEADLADVTRTAREAQVVGCAFQEADVTGDGTVTVTVRPRVWFGLVDFAEVPPGSAAAPTVVDRALTAHIAFGLGLTQLGAYQFAYTPRNVNGTSP